MHQRSNNYCQILKPKMKFEIIHDKWLHFCIDSKNVFNVFLKKTFFKVFNIKKTLF